MTYQREIGNRGEKIAADYLEDKGYQLLEKNYHTRYGELDIVMLHKGMVVFVEVKTRTNKVFGFPEESVTSSKMEHLQNAALLWLQEHPEAPDDWRIDVVSIYLDRNNQAQNINHFINAIL
jgi:putative endonuclease